MILRSSSTNSNRKITISRRNFEVRLRKRSSFLYTNRWLVNANAEQKARLLEIRVAENADTIEQLRQERALLVSDHKGLQHRFSEISEVTTRIRLSHYNADLI